MGILFLFRLAPPASLFVFPFRFRLAWPGGSEGRRLKMRRGFESSTVIHVAVLYYWAAALQRRRDDALARLARLTPSFACPQRRPPTVS